MDKKIYYGVTILFALMLSASATFYLFNHDDVVISFGKMGFPGYIVYPLAIAKILGSITLLFINSDSLKEWAYAGFFFNILLAFSAHVNAGDGHYLGAAVALLLLLTSYFFWKRMQTAK